MIAEFEPTKVRIAQSDAPGSTYAAFLGEVDRYGPQGSTLDYGIGLHPALSPLINPQRRLPELLTAIDNHTTYVTDHVSDQTRRDVLLISLRGLRSRLRLLAGESISPSQMVFDAYNISLSSEPYDDSWVLNYYKHEVLPLIPERFFPDSAKKPEDLLLAYNAFKDAYRLSLLKLSSTAGLSPYETLEKTGRYVARLIFERAQERGVLTFDSVDAALQPLSIVPVIDSEGGESGYFRFDEHGTPVDTFNWQSKSEPTAWELLLTQTHELAGHYQEYTEKIAMAWRKGWSEWAVAGLYSPAAFFSEGVAQVVPKYLYPDAQSVLKAVLKIYDYIGQRIDAESRRDILNLIKIHQLVEYNPRLEAIRLNAIRHLEEALQIEDDLERGEAIKKAGEYFQSMCLRSEEQAERRVKFMRTYGGYTYVYPVSVQAYWKWFEDQGQTPDALLRLMREPIVLSIN